MILRTCIINVLCQLEVKYYLVKIFIVQCNLPIKFQYHSFLDLGLCGLFSACEISLLKPVEAFQIHAVYNRS